MLNSHNSPILKDSIRRLYYDKESIPPAEQSLPYQTKVSIFDEKCKGCRWAYRKIEEMTNRSTGESSRTYVFPPGLEGADDFEKFIKFFSFQKELYVERGCRYSAEQFLEGSLNREEYWTVAEIVENGCKLWRPNEIPAKVEFEIVDDQYYPVRNEVEYFDIVGV